MLSFIFVVPLVTLSCLGLAPPAVSQDRPAAQHRAVDVALDPGHSSWDVGSSAPGLRELEVTLDVAGRVRDQLEARGYSVRLTRTDAARVAPSVPGDATSAIQVEQEARHTAAGEARAYVSIHFNGHPDRTLRGTETYYNPENHGEPSLALARALQEETVAALHLAGFETLDRGVRPDLLAGKPYGHFFSLRGPFPSALIEVLFLTNAQDAAILREERGREAAAEGIGRGILRFLEDDQAPLQAQADPCPWT